MNGVSSCWLAENGEYPGEYGYNIAVFHKPCEGPLDHVHLIPRQVLRRELGSRLAGFDQLVVVGCRKHHHLLDVSKKLRIPRYRLPESVEQFAADNGLVWWLDRTYGPLEAQAA